MNTFLSPHDTAFKLGITQELLWMYTRYAPKPIDDRKLLYYHEHQGFDADDIEAWEKYLQLPWVESGEKRPSIPTYIRDYLKIEAKGQCALCGIGHKLEDAHIEPFEETRNHFHHNLIRLCTDCHSKYDDGIISKEVIRLRKNELIADVKANLKLEKIFSIVNAPVIDNLFIGRQAEKQEVVESLKINQVTIVKGVGGVGKTQLVLNALQDYKPSRNVAWVNLENVSTNGEVETLLKRILKTISSQANSSEQYELYNILALFDGIIVLDGIEDYLFHDWDTSIDFISQIIGFATSTTFVITSQSEMIGLKPSPKLISVDPLKSDDMNELFAIALGENKPSAEEFKWLVDYSDGHPLTARIMVSLLEYFKDFEKVQSRVLNLGADALKMPVRSKQRRSTALSSCLEVAHECLSHEQKRLLQYITRFPGGCPLYRLEKWQENSDFDLNLAEIRRLHFVSLKPNPILGYESVYMLNPVKNFVGMYWKNNYYEEAAEIQLEVAKDMAFWASYIAFEKLQSSTINEFERGVAFVEADLQNFISAMNYGIEGSNQYQGSDSAKKYLDIVIGIANLSVYFYLTGQPTLAVHFNLKSAEAYTKMGNLVGAVEQYDAVASTLASMYDLSGLKQISEKIGTITRDTTNAIVMAYHYLNLGRIDLLECNYQSAISNTELSSDLLHAIDNPELEKNSLTLRIYGQLALEYQESKQTHDAIKYYQKAQKLREKLGIIADDGVHHHQLGNCYYDLGDLKSAESNYVKAAIHFSRIGNGIHLTNSLSELGSMVVERNLAVDTLAKLNEDLLEQGLDALLSEIQIFALHFNSANFSHDAKYMLIRKIFNIIKLLSFSPHVALLENWANDYQQFQNEFMEDLKEQNQNTNTISEDNQVDRYPVGWFLLRLHDYAVLAHCVSQSDIKQAEEVIDAMFELSYLDFSTEIENMGLEPYSWLKKWKSKVSSKDLK